MRTRLNRRWLVVAGTALWAFLASGCSSSGSSVASGRGSGGASSADGGPGGGGTGGSAQPSCSDGLQNGTETGIDCGGSSCPKCANGQSCNKSSDCQSGVCLNGMCTTAQCSDGTRDGTETDVDCGGTCPPCDANAVCNVDSDCKSKNCDNFVCGGNCTDGIKDGDESDIDCGGSTCPKCKNGSTCNSHTDCESDGCANGRCAVPCSAGDIVCAGNTAKTCDGHGGYSDVTDCSATSTVCATLLGCVTCIPDTGSCKGNTSQVCKQDGSGYTTVDCDPLEGLTCDASTGRCKGDCAPSKLGTSYVGCEYFPTVTANPTTPSVFHFAVAVSNTTSTAATVTITRGTTTVATKNIPGNSVAKINLPWVNSLKGPGTSSVVVPFPASVDVAGGAYRLRSTEPVTVYQFNPLEYTASGQFSYTNDASLLLPTNAWGSAYRGIARATWAGFSGFVTVTAGQDGTKVTFAPGPQTGTFKGGVSGVATTGSGTVTLNAGDAVELASRHQRSNRYPRHIEQTGAGDRRSPVYQRAVQRRLPAITSKSRSSRSRRLPANTS